MAGPKGSDAGGKRPLNRLLVANRGEIAIRAFRAASQLDIGTIAVVTAEEERSGSLHRIKADEAYVIGEPGRPVRAYLDHEAIVGTAVEVGADAIYPGYGFLSESPALARAAGDAGLIFVGPDPSVLELTGNKMRARQAAEEAGLPVARQSPPLDDDTDVAALAADLGFPLFVKAASGGGGRGLRRVEAPEDLADAVVAARREAESAFGNPTVFLEEALIGVRHIEVQILADQVGNVVHLFERDCSVQRRFQKVIEVAPARDLDPEVRQRLLDDAVRFATAIGYVNAGTVEFLVDGSGRHIFIEMNPRIQVEHTVTEEITDVDIVEAQLRIAGGATLPELGLHQDTIRVNGFALQSRVTAEDPTNGLRPDTGRIVAYRPASGAGIRLDGCIYQGVEISAFFDSMLEKITCRGPDFDTVVRRARRALTEYRVRGVATNQSYLLAILGDDEFLTGPVTTDFVDRRPELTAAGVGADRATRLLRYLADVTVNRPHGPAPTTLDPATKLPPLPVADAGAGGGAGAGGDADSGAGPVPGSRQRLLELGPERFAAELRAQTALGVTDTTLRDAHQSILATRVRTLDLVNGARHLAQLTPQLLSVECWGGATFDVALRFLHEDPWQRLDRLRDAMPNLCTQMLLRGRNTVGYSPYPDTVARAFVAEAAESGIDIFRIFDACNDIEQMRPAIEAVRDVGHVAEGTLCYSGDLSSPDEDIYTLDYYLGVAEELDVAGAHILCIKDMAGLLRPAAAEQLVSALRARFPQPVHLHTHDTSGGQLATYLAAIDVGVDAVDAAAPPLSGMTSQPSLGALVAMTDGTDHATGIDLDAIGRMEPYWEALRRVYAPFEAGLTSPTSTVYRHEIPGGQLSNLRAQAAGLGLDHRFEEVEDRYAEANVLLGRPIKVTPSSKVVGDLALHLVASGVTVEELNAAPETVDLPDSVIGFLNGELGQPVAGFPEPFRTNAVADRPWQPTQSTLSQADEHGLTEDRRATLSRLLFPEPSRSCREAIERWGDLSIVPSLAFWYGLEARDEELSIRLGPGVRVLIGLKAIGDANEEGLRVVSFRVNGQNREIEVRDRSVATSVTDRERADTADPGHVATPFRGVVNVTVSVGDPVERGDAVATIEAMKMESTVSAPISGTVVHVAAPPGATLDPGDLVLVISPTGRSTSPESDISA